MVLNLHDWLTFYGNLKLAFGKWVNLENGESYHREGLLLMGLPRLVYIFIELLSRQHIVKLREYYLIPNIMLLEV